MRASHAPAKATCSMEYKGRLVSNAHAAQRPTDHQGHFAPTLCFEVVSLLTGQHCEVQQYFPVGHDKECEAAAAKLRKGDIVTFQVENRALRLIACGASHVRHAEDGPDLFEPAAAVATADA
jgi:hypothetical protein